MRTSLQVGTYVLRERLGGGMNEVWRAWDERHGREVALKLLRMSEAHEVTRARFAREAELLQAIGSPHTVQFLEHGVTAEYAYVAMEYLRGLDVDVLVGTYGAVDVPRALHLMRQACQGAADAHAAGVLHRDLKPANLLCSDRAGEEDMLRILDFGVARRRGSARITLDGAAVGTPAFMAPEAFTGADVTPASDVYTLGCTFYFAITGSTVFEDGDVEHVRDAHRFGPVVPPSLRGERVDLPRGLERVILRALAKRPRDRFPDAAAMRAALDAAAHDVAAWTAADATAWWARAAAGLAHPHASSAERTTEVGVVTPIR